MSAALIAKLASASEGAVWTNADANELIDALGRDRCGPSFAAVPLALLALRGSIDAALALAERVLPEHWTWRIEKNEGGYFVAFWSDGDYAPDGAAVCSTPALAICAALLRASAAEGAGHE